MGRPPPRSSGTCRARRVRLLRNQRLADDRRQRRAGAQTIVSAPEVFTGRIPRRVRGRSPAALAGYELPMALLGFPGVGWLFAGFSFTASVLLLAGPALTWAVIPLAFSPYGEGPLNTIGWKVELVWIPATAFLSTVLLYRAQRRRRLLLVGPPKPPRTRRRKSGYRTRVSVAAGTIALLLVSIPFVPAVAGVGGSSIRYAYQTRFTPDIIGQFLTTRRGPVKLFTWEDPQSPYPGDALRVRAADVRALVARAAAVDDPAAYGLYDLDQRARVPLRVRSGTGRQLDLVPGRRLRPGRYMFVATHQGMFGGRDFAYLTVVRPGEPVTPISSSGKGNVPRSRTRFCPWRRLLSPCCSSSSWRGRTGSVRPARRRFGQRALASSQSRPCARPSVSERGGLRRSSARITCGRRAHRCVPRRRLCLAVAPPTGERRLARRARGRQRRGGRFRLARPVNEHMLARTPSGRPPDNSALVGHAFLWAVVLNSAGPQSSSAARCSRSRGAVVSARTSGLPPALSSWLWGRGCRASVTTRSFISGS